MFWDRFFKLCYELKIAPNSVAKSIGAGNSACTKWKSGTIPSSDSLIKIANFFDCSVDYLLGRTENQQSHKSVSSMSIGNVSGNSGAIGIGNTVTNSATPLDGFQELLIELYNKLTPEEQIDLIHDLKNKHNKKNT